MGREGKLGLRPVVKTSACRCGSDEPTLRCGSSGWEIPSLRRGLDRGEFMLRCVSGGWDPHSGLQLSFLLGTPSIIHKGVGLTLHVHLQCRAVVKPSQDLIF